jgi:hypothetical protein
VEVKAIHGLCDAGLAACALGCALSTGAIEISRVFTVRPVVVVLLATTRAGCTGAAAPAFLVGEALGEALLATACAGGTRAAPPVVDVVEGTLLAATCVEDTGQQRRVTSHWEVEYLQPQLSAQWAKRNRHHRSKTLVWWDPEERWTSRKRETKSHRTRRVERR